MNTYKKYIPNAIIAVLLITVIYLWNSKEEEVIIPPKTGTFISTSPEAVVIYDTITLDGSVEYIKVPNPVNKELLSKYNNALDSIGRLSLYKEAITERKYIEKFEDSVQKITVESNVIGTLKNQKITYKTKPITVSLKKPKNRLEFYGGISTQIPIETPLEASYEALAVGVSLNVVTNKNIYSIGINSNKTIMAGIAFKI